MKTSKPTYEELEDQLLLTTSNLNESQSLSKIGSWHWDVVTNEVTWSDMMYTLLGLEQGKDVPSYETALHHVHTDDKLEYEKLLNASVENKTPYFMENRITKKDKSTLHVISRGVCLLNENGDLTQMHGTVQDISLWKEIEKINTEKRDAEEKSNALLEFHSIISHDLNIPFSSLQGINIGLAKSIQNKKWEEVEIYATILQDVTDHGVELLNNLLLWSTAETNKISFNPKKVVLAPLLNEINDEFSNHILSKNISIEIVANPEQDVYADENMLKIILRNLFSNAIKFSHSNGNIVLTISQLNNKTQFKLSDKGTGIHPNTLKKLFQEQTMNSTVGTNNEKGTGFGLLICKNFIDRHQGKIWIESEFNVGTTCYFSLPAN